MQRLKKSQRKEKNIIELKICCIRVNGRKVSEAMALPLLLQISNVIYSL
jgi:hypothetical protein